MDLERPSELGRVPGAGGLKSITLLQWAVMSDNADAVQALLEGGADPNRVPTINDNTPLHYAVLRQDERLMQLLLASGADVRATATYPLLYHSTALMYLFEEDAVLMRSVRGSNDALSTGQRMARAEILLSKGSDVNQALWRSAHPAAASTWAERPIFRLSLGGNWLGVLWFLEHGADPRARNAAGGTFPCAIRNRLRVMRGYQDPASAPSDLSKRWHLAPDSPMQQVINWMLNHGFQADEFEPDKHPNKGCWDVSPKS